MMNKENEIKIGPVTAKLLRALEYIESAREQFYLATQELRGESDDFEDHMTDEETVVFDQARDLVENMIGDNIRTWANTTDPQKMI